MAREPLDWNLLKLSQTFSLIIICPLWFLFRFVLFCFVSPEFSYRAGLPGVPEGTASVSSPGATSSSGTGGAPNRPLPPTPDDDESQGDRTLVLRKVCQPISFLVRIFLFIWLSCGYFFRLFSPLEVVFEC